MIAYDWRTRVGQYTIMTNGQCSFMDPFSYNTLFLFLFIVIIVKFLQITMFSAITTSLICMFVLHRSL